MLIDRPQPGQTDPSGAWTGRSLAVAAVLTFAALALRLYRLGAQELWIDEAYSFLLADQRDWLGLPTLANNTPPLYHWLLRLWMGWAGDGEAALRALSALVGALLVPAIIWTGRELMSRPVGLWAGGWAAVAVFHIYYSQEARAYALLALTLTLTYGCAAHAIRVRTRLAWACMALSATLALYSHYFAVLGLLPTVLLPWALGAERSGSIRRGYAAAMGAALLLFLPWGLAAWLLAPHTLQDASDTWMATGWLNTPPSLAIPKSLEMLVFGGEHGFAPSMLKQFRSIEFPVWARLIGLAGSIALLIWTLRRDGDERLALGSLTRRKLWLVTALLFPLLALWFTSLLVKPVYVVGRYDIVAFPASALLLGLGFAKLWTVGLRSALPISLAALLIIGTLLAKLIVYYQAPAPVLGPTVASHITSLTGNGDVLLVGDPSGHALLYYLHRAGYDWHAGVCRNRTSGALLHCRFLPLRAEQTLHGIAAAYPSVQGIREDLEEILRPVRQDEATVWIYTQHEPLWDSDEILVGQLMRLGFAPAPAPAGSHLYAFRRPVPSVSTH